jgi:hypothetical protein
MTDHTTDRVLYALYCLSRDTCQIDASAVGRAVGISAVQAATVLVALERASLVDASRARLTMFGLARAARLEAASGGAPALAIDLQQQRPRRAVSSVPIAAQACTVVGVRGPTLRLVVPRPSNVTPEPSARPTATNITNIEAPSEQ